MLMDFEEISVDQAIKYVANYCITNNLYRQGNTFHEFDDSFVNTLNAMFPNLDVAVATASWMIMVARLA